MASVSESAVVAVESAIDVASVVSILKNVLTFVTGGPVMWGIGIAVILGILGLKAYLNKKKLEMIERQNQETVKKEQGQNTTDNQKLENDIEKGEQRIEEVIAQNPDDHKAERPTEPQ